MVLDGAIDPNVPVAQQNLTQAIGFESALYAFIDECQSLPVCPLPKSDDAAKEEMTTLYTSAAANPLPQKKSRDNRLVTESLMVLGTAAALYDNLIGWPTLRKAIQEAQQGYGDTFIKLADIYSERQSNGKYLNISQILVQSLIVWIGAIVVLIKNSNRMWLHIKRKRQSSVLTLLTPGLRVSSSQNLKKIR
jgi:hypothetical protein